MRYPLPMRLWISPDNDIVDLDDEDEPHSLFVANHPEWFGLREAPVRAHLEALRDPEADLEFDYDTVIVMAEMGGWVRMSRDASQGSAAVSASDPKHARRALRHLSELAPGFMAVDLEIERIEGKSVVRCLRRLSPDETILFMDRGILPPARSYSTEISETSLLDALLPEPAATPAA